MLKPKFFLYARKSTEDDDKQIMSIEAQLFELREFAARENLEILAEFQESKSCASIDIICLSSSSVLLRA